MWHTHNWVEKERIIAEPVDVLKMGRFEVSEFLAERLLFGIVTIVMECSKCHELSTTEILGVKR